MHSIFSEFSLMWNFFKIIMPMMIILLIFILNSLLNKMINKQKNWLFFIYKVLSDLFKSEKFSLKSLLLITIFLFIMFMNMFSLILPHYPKISVHLNFSMMLSLMCWFTIMLSFLFKNFNYYMQQNIPSSSPILLSMFLFLFENLSNFIRPMTLAFRICAITFGANIIMILTLTFMLNNNMFITMSLNNITVTITIFLMGMILFIYDFMICLIQAYIFTSLVSNYSTEHP